MNRRIYVAGPMTKGDFWANVHAAIDAAQALRERGWFPHVPHFYAYWNARHERPYEDWLAQDFCWLEACEAIVRLPGDSAGADREVAYAQRLGMPVFYRLESVPNAEAMDRRTA